MLRRTFVIGLLGLAAVGSAAGERSRPLFAAPDPVLAVAADGGAVAWMTEQRYAVRVRLAGARRASAIAGPREAPVDVPLFAFGGGRALWSWTRSRRATDILVGAPAARGRVVETIRGGLVLEDGEVLVDLAARGPALAYSVLAVRGDAVVDGRVMRIPGRDAVEVPGAPPALLVAAGGGRLALVPAAREIVGADLRPEPRVELRDPISGRLLGGVRTTGRPAAVALSRDVLAVLVHDARRTWIERYALPRLAPLGRTGVRPGAWQLGVAGQTIVFATGRVIRALDARTGRSRILVAAAREPAGVAVDGRRVVWASNVAGEARFFSVAI